nr:zinc knuckle CX2CX4HX4C [Tanacetum cinerariifolium]
VENVDDLDKEEYKKALLARFDIDFDDHLSELKNLNLCKMQEATIAAHKTRQTPILPIPKLSIVNGSFGNRGSYVAPRTQSNTLALPASMINPVLANPTRKGVRGKRKRMRFSKCLNMDGDQDSYLENGEGLNGDKNIEDMLHMVHETTSEVTSSFNVGNSTQPLDENMVSQLHNENTVVDLFVAPLSSIEHIDVLTRKIKAGGYEDVMSGMTSVEWKAAIEEIEVVWKKLFADMSGTTNVPINEGTSPKVDTLIGLFFFKLNSIKGLEYVLDSGPWMIRNSLISLNKLTMNTSLCKEELTCISVWVKVHDVPLQVFLEDGISLIASQIGKPIMLDSFTSSMCIESWGQSSFARCLIEIKVDEALKDSITMGIPLPEGMGFTKKMVHVEYEWKPPRYKQCSTVVKTTWQPIKQNVRFDPTSYGNLQHAHDGNIMHSDSKEKPTKLVNIPPPSYTRGSGKKGGLQYLTSASNIHTSDRYDSLDDMESDERVEVIFNETLNLLDNIITRANYTAPDASKTGSVYFFHVGVVDL